MGFDPIGMGDMGDENIQPKTPEQPSEVWGYAESPDAEAWRGFCGTREEAIAEARDNLLVAPTAPIFVVRGRVPSVEEFIPTADDILEIAGNTAQDECGEAAEDFPDVSDEGKLALSTMLSEWAKKHIDPIRFWIADGETERIDPPPLHLWNDSVNFVVAESAVSARAILLKALGIGDDDTPAADEWERWPADKPFTIVEDGDEKTKRSMLPADWAKINGPGYIGSTEM